MDCFKEIKDAISEFCNLTPAKGFEINYLQTATEVWNLYAEACKIMEENEESKENRLKEIYKQIKGLIS